MTSLLKDMGPESCIHLWGLSVPKKLGLWILPLMALLLRGSVILTESVPLSPMFGSVSDPCDRFPLNFCECSSSFPWREDGKNAAGLPGGGGLMQKDSLLGA